MPWQPSAHVWILRESEGKTRPNLIGRSTSNELVTEVGFVLGGGLVLDVDAVNTTQHMSRRASILLGEPEHARGRCRTSS
jgi:hypothetical protein